MTRQLIAFAITTACALGANAQAPANVKPATQVKPQSGQVKALNPQPLPPVSNRARSTTVSPTSPNARALNPQPLPPGGNVKAPAQR